MAMVRVQAVVEFTVETENEEGVDLADLEACIAEGVDDFLFASPTCEPQGFPTINSDIVEVVE